MADGSKIEWTDATWNIITGCSVLSPGCTNCYAMRLAGTRLKHHPSRAGLTMMSKAGPVWKGQVRFNEEWLLQPLQWARPRRIFVCAHGDLFHEAVEEEWLDNIFAVFALCPQHMFQILTKRPARARDYLSCAEHEDSDWLERLGDIAVALTGSPCAAGTIEDIDWPLRNVWLGVSCENQEWADKRVPVLLDTPAAVRWVSAEPLLGPIDFKSIARLDWIVAGGESGADARPMHPDWARSIRDQCAAAGVAFHFKQWGQWAPHKPVAGGDLGGDVRSGRVRIVHPTGQSDVEVVETTGGRSTIPGSRYMAAVGKKAAGRLLDGRTHDAWPEVR